MGGVGKNVSGNASVVLFPEPMPPAETNYAERDKDNSNNDNNDGNSNIKNNGNNNNGSIYHDTANNNNNNNNSTKPSSQTSSLLSALESMRSHDFNGAFKNTERKVTVYLGFFSANIHFVAPLYTKRS